MNLRREGTYLSNDVWRACRLIAKSKGTITDEQGLQRTVTADEIADDILRRVIKAEYPQTLEYLKQTAKLESELVKQLGGAKVT